MALHSKDDWVTLFTTNGIPLEEVITYANIFVANCIPNTTLTELTKTDLTDLGITVLGDIKTIPWLSPLIQATAVPADASSDQTHPQFMKIPAAQPPQILPDMTNPQFRKFHTDWNVFKKITNLPDSQIHAQLYNSCDESVQNSLVNSVTNFFDLHENDLLHQLENIVTRKCNPAIHRLTFSSLHQSETESIQEFVVCLKSISPECEFICPQCHHDLQNIHIKDQFIWGINNEHLQTDILAKASQLSTLEQVIKHASVYEAAQLDQAKLQTHEAMAI